MPPPRDDLHLRVRLERERGHPVVDAPCPLRVRARVRRSRPRRRALAPSRVPISRRTRRARAQAASGEPQRHVPTGKSAWVLALSLAVAAAVCYLTTEYTQFGQAAYSALSKSGFTAAFALIFVSELGDKTFFIAALLAMRLGRFTVLAGATTALSFMSVISPSLVASSRRFPSTLNDSVPIGEYLAVALLLFFGIRTLREALDTPEVTDDAESGEFADAAEAVTKSRESEQGGTGAKASSRNSGSVLAGVHRGVG